MVGSGSRTALVTLVERKSGYVKIAKVNHRQAPTVARAVQRKLRPLPAALRKTMTLDNGKEFAEHRQIARRLGLAIYHAEPYKAWQRGTNENTNGLIRQFFPKGADLADYSHSDAANAETLLNERPRKRHGYRTPSEVISPKLALVGAFET